MALLVLCGVATARAADADEPAATAAAADSYEEAYRRGLERYQAGDDPGAIVIWQGLLESLGEAQAWKLLYSLGLAHERSGDATQAIARFRGFVAAIDAQPAPRAAEIEERRADAAARVARLEASHGALRVQAAPGELALVRIGTAQPRPAGFTAYLAPGTHSVELYVGTGRAERRSVQLTAGEQTVIELAAAPSKPASTPPRPRPAPRSVPAAPQPTHGFPTTWLVVGASATAASFALPWALGARASSKRDAAEALGRGHTGYAAAVDDYQSARSLYYWSYAVPVALAAATTVIVVVQSGDGDAPSVGVAVQPGSGMVGVVGRL